MDIYPDDNELSFPDGKGKTVLEKLYSENETLYMQLAHEDDASETVVFTKAAEEFDIADGYHTYVDNDSLMPALTGTWTGDVK